MHGRENSIELTIPPLAGIILKRRGPSKNRPKAKPKAKRAASKRGAAAEEGRRSGGSDQEGLCAQALDQGQAARHEGIGRRRILPSGEIRQLAIHKENASMSKLFETTDEFKEAYRAIVMAEVGKDIASAHGAEQYRALAKLIATRANRQFAECDSENGRSDRKKVYYFSLEFLIGPLLDQLPSELRRARPCRAGPLRDGHLPRRAALAERSTPALATGVWGASPPASSTPWRARASSGSATACATATGCSARRSSTAGRSR